MNPADWQPSHLGTFGGSPAGDVVDKILNELNDSSLFSYVGKRLADVELVAKGLAEITDLRVRAQLKGLYRQHLDDTVDKNLRDDLRSHLMTHMITMLKRCK